MKYQGPYLRKEDNRQIMIVTEDSGIKTTISYARYLMEQKLGRKLTSNEEVDHNDGDKTNDAIDNLYVRTKYEHRVKHGLKNIGGTLYKFNCPVCKIEAERLYNQVKMNLKRGCKGPFCSRECARIAQSNPSLY